MKIKFNKKILTSLSLSCLLLAPIVLTSCGSDNKPIPQQIKESDYLYSDRNIGRGYYEDIGSLYQKYGSKIYYQDNNGLWTLDFSKFKYLENMHAFSFGSFENEINQLTLPPNLKYLASAALYPDTENGYLYAKNGINPMFKVISKKGPNVNVADKYYFNLDISNLMWEVKSSNFYNNKGYWKRDGIPTQIYPIDSFEFVNSNNLYDKFQSKQKNGFEQYEYTSPPLPLNLLSNTNYLRYYVSDQTLANFKNEVYFEHGYSKLHYNYTEYSFPQLTFPFGVTRNEKAPYTLYKDPKSNEYINPAVVSHPYFFKYILYAICQNQLNRKANSANINDVNASKMEYIYTPSNDIFSNDGNYLSISFINQDDESEIIDLKRAPSSILEILNYDFNSNRNVTSSLDPKVVSLLEKWKRKYDMLDNWRF